MKTCKCGRIISPFAVYCEHCKKNLSLREKVIEGLRKDNFCVHCMGRGVTQPFYLDGDYEECRFCLKDSKEDIK